MEERNENVMTYEENVNNIPEVEAMYVEPEKVELKIDYKALAAGAAALIGGIYVAKKWIAPKLEAWNESRLAKKGYVKLKPGEMIVQTQVEDADSEDMAEAEEVK